MRHPASMALVAALLCLPAAAWAEAELVGRFTDGPVEGLSYASESGSGLTDAEGSFRYRAGETVTFKVGELPLGSVVLQAAAARVTPAHLVPGVDGDLRKIKDRRVGNLARLVQSLDRDGRIENGITITRQAAKLVSDAARIDFDQDEAAFARDPAVVDLVAKLGITLRGPAEVRNHLRRSLLGVRKLTDVPITTRDAKVQLLGDVFVPLEAGRFPVILSSTKYGKASPRGCACTPAAVQRSEASEDAYFEDAAGVGSKPDMPSETMVMPNMADWVPRGYVLVRIDGRGSCNTPGLLHPYSAQEAEDNYDAIEWAGAQPWSSGQVGMWGVSFTAASQLPVASLQPPSLKAIIPHSGDLDQYRDIVFQGGLYYQDYRENWFRSSVAGEPLRCLGQPYADIVSLFRENRFDDPKVYGPYARDPATGEQLPRGPISPDPAKITVPIWSTMRQDIWPIHIRGGAEVFRHVASAHKKLWVEAGHEYSRAWSRETLALHVRFFDRWLKGGQNGIMDEPPVRLDIRQPRGPERPNGGWVSRFESEWPLARTQYVRLYLDATAPDGDGALSRSPPAAARSTTYSADIERGPGGAKLACSATGVSFVSAPFEAETEIAGYMKLAMPVSSTTRDMDIFASLRVLDEGGREVFYHATISQESPVTLGFLKASHRKLDPARSTAFQPVLTHRQADHQPLVPGEPTALEVELWPNTALIKPGHRLKLTLQPHDSCFRWNNSAHEYDRSYHAGAANTIHTGGAAPAYLQIPVVPPKD